MTGGALCSCCSQVWPDLGAHPYSGSARREGATLSIPSKEMLTRENSGALRVRTLGELLADCKGQPETILEPWLRERQLHMTYAPTGVGKTMFILSIAIAVAGGGELFGWKAPKARKVLIWDGEMDPADLKERAKALLEAVPGINSKAVLRNLSFCAYQDQADDVRFPDNADPEGRERVLEITRERPPALVILDNYSTLAMVDDENDASSFNPGMELLRELKKLGCATILVHHSRKDGGSFRGTSKMAAIFDHMTSLHPAEERELHNGVGFKLKWEKYRGVWDERLGELTAHLRPGFGWTFEVNQKGRLEAFRTAVMSGKHPTAEALGTTLRCSKGQVSKLARKAVEAGVMTREEYLNGLQRGKARRADLDAMDSDPEGVLGEDQGDY